MGKLTYIGSGMFVCGGRHVSTDWEYPSFAAELGWSLRRVQKRGKKVVHFARRVKGCEHRSTDGTVKCPECSIEASDFIAAAGEYLHRRAS
jgi:hypothetical protein